MRIGDATVEIWGTRITWPDGTEVLGAPHDTDSYRETARLCGYGEDTLKLCIEHEVLYVALAMWLGVPSEVMAKLRGEEADERICSAEERAVLSIQSYINACGISLVDRI